MLVPAIDALDAIILADDATSRVRIAGLEARERAVRVARRVGAERIHIVDGDRAALADFRSTRPVLVIRADQLVHTPLVAPLIDRVGDRLGDRVGDSVRDHDDLAIAVGPDGAYAGAILATGTAATDLVARLARGESDTAIAKAATTRVPHGTVARHPIGTPAERRAATRLLYTILVKPQDNALTRYIYRPVSLPLTKLLVWTPITPNQVSLFVAAIVAFGCWLTAHASTSMAIAGTAVILSGQYFDCCDGEIARIKLQSSRLGAWLDTIIDEASSIAYMVALGYHCHLAYGPHYLGDLGFDPWLAMIAVGFVTYVWAMYCIYFNIIVAVGSANSQDYVGSFDVVPGRQPNTVRLRPAAPTAIATKELPPWLAFLATYLPYAVRRDFLSWISLVLAILHLTHVLFVLLAAGGVITAVIVTGDHVRLRRLRRSIIAGGQILEPAS